MRTIPAELVKRYEAEGWWTRDTMGDLLARGLQTAAGTTFRVHSDVRPWAGTFADVELVARRLAAGLHERGVGPGDVIAFQLPNWMEAAAVFWASAFLGAVVVPVVHFYGRKEVTYILKSVEPRVFVTALKFGRLEFQPDLCANVPVVGVVGVVDRDFDELLAQEPMPGVLAADPAGPALIAFTSGTTRDPKGVIHSHQTLGFEVRQLAERYPPDRGRQLTAAPVGHFIGMLNAFLIPLLDGSPVNLADVWDPARVLALMASDGLTVGGGAPYYLTSLLDHPDCSPAHLAQMKYAGLGGASVPAAVTTRLAGLGITAWRSYGSTEHPSITGCPYDAPEDKRLYTDGDALPGVEIRLAPDGEIFSRGPDLCLGYTDPKLTERAFDDEGWYRTGRHRRPRRRRVPHDHRPHRRPHHPRRREHQRHRGRRGAAGHARRRRGRGGGRPRPPARRARRGRAAAHAWLPEAHYGAAAKALRAGRPGPPEVAGGTAPGRRLPADREREGPEVRPPIKHCSLSRLRIRFSCIAKEDLNVSARAAVPVVRRR